MRQIGFWDLEVEGRYALLAKQHDLLLQLDQIIPWEMFLPTLNQIHEKERKSNAGRKPINPLILFKMLVLQQLYNISDEKLEYQVNDRLSFMKFLHLGIGDKVPDATTVWIFREQLTKRGLIKELFEQFDGYLNEKGYQASGEHILDATIVPVPKQRNTKEENEQIKNGEIPEGWKENAHKLSQKDVDARWTEKNHQSHYGYKNHINVDVTHKLIRQYEVTEASVHDSQVVANLLDCNNSSNDVYGDSAFRSEKLERVLKLLGYISHIHERAYRNRPLSEEQEAENRKRSQTRVRVEHVFGSWVNEMGGKAMRLIGKVRNSAAIGMKNLTYNIKRYVHLQGRCA